MFCIREGHSDEDLLTGRTTPEGDGPTRPRSHVVSSCLGCLACGFGFRELEGTTTVPKSQILFQKNRTTCRLKNCIVCLIMLKLRHLWRHGSHHDHTEVGSLVRPVGVMSLRAHRGVLPRLVSRCLRLSRCFV